MSIFEFSQRIIDEVISTGQKRLRLGDIDKESYKAGARDVMGIAINVAIELQKKERAEMDDERALSRSEVEE